MKTKLKLIAIGWLLAAIGFSARAQGTAFTYQGRLNSSGSPASGNYDFRFRLDADPLGNTILATTSTNAVPVTNGLFITTIDFGAGWFNGSNYWLEVDVRTNAASTYVGLTPLQPLLPTPYAIMANSASNLLGALPAAQLSGTLQNSSLPASPTFSGAVTANSFSGNGANVTGVNAASLNGLGAANFWQTGGNAGTTPGMNFLGTTDNEPLEFNVNGQRTLRLQPSPTAGNPIPNIIGGHPDNTIDAALYGSVIAGGGGPGTFRNAITDFGYLSAIVGGYDNSSDEENTFIGGGAHNRTSGRGATVSGGYNNQANGIASTVGGGTNNTASGDFSTVAGGSGNTASGQWSFAAGNDAQAVNQGAFVWADSQTAFFSSTNNDSFNVRAQGGARFVTGGTGMSVDGSLTIAGVSQYNSGLKVTGSNASGTGLAIENTASGGHKYDLISGGAGSGEGAGAFELYDETVVNGFRLTITPNGNVGIGTFTPTTLLQVKGVVTANSFSGSAGGLTGLSATAITGTVADTNLSANVALLNRSTQSFTGGINTFSGNVGIGTSTPTKALLEVEGNVANVDQGAFEYYNISGTPAHATGSPTGQNYSIWASDRIAGSEFNAYSDARIKNIEGQSDAAADLKTLLGIKITDYTYKDTIANGNRSVKKVIAQQVEQVYPQAVSKSTGEVPDIYKLATIKDGWIQLVTDLKVGDRVKLIGEKEQGIYPVLAVGDGVFRTDFKPDAKKVFVYGRQVKDFRSVDYEAIAMLNVSATQELARKLDAQQTENAKLQAQVTDLQSQLESLQKVVAQLATKSSGGLALNTQPQEAK